MSIGERIARLSVTTALAALVGIVAAACGTASRSEYCDTTGCYTCDGYGCRAVAPGTTTTPTPDAGNPSIPGDDGARCATPCGAGTTCVESECRACGGSSGPCPCTAPGATCASGLECVAGACVAASDACRFSSECGAGKVCADGRCLAACTDAQGCGAGFNCTKGACTPTGASAACSSDAACPPSTPRCVSGSCRAACVQDTECDRGTYCSQGVCLLDTRPKPNCIDNSACASQTQQCVSGYCRYVCTSDRQCQQIDKRIATCVEGFCRAPAEARPACTRAADCAAGESCVSNVCR